MMEAFELCGIRTRVLAMRQLLGPQHVSKRNSRRKRNKLCARRDILTMLAR
jgi:hypothetical protein